MLRIINLSLFPLVHYTQVFFAVTVHICSSVVVTLAFRPKHMSVLLGRPFDLCLFVLERVTALQEASNAFLGYGRVVRMAC
jgi:hypothetical protein